ncbi:MAG: hypothetical protein ACKOVA_16740 [Novosphingobium sp.]
MLFMAECQLNDRQDEVSNCFADVQRTQDIYFAMMALSLLACIIFQSLGSKWTKVALIGLAIAPPASILFF